MFPIPVSSRRNHPPLPYVGFVEPGRRNLKREIVLRCLLGLFLLSACGGSSSRANRQRHATRCRVDGRGKWEAQVSLALLPARASLAARRPAARGSSAGSGGVGAAGAAVHGSGGFAGRASVGSAGSTGEVAIAQSASTEPSPRSRSRCSSASTTTAPLSANRPRSSPASPSPACKSRAAAVG